MERFRNRINDNGLWQGDIKRDHTAIELLSRLDITAVLNAALLKSMILMRVAIAGTNGLAQLLANELEYTTPHQFIFFSRRAVPGLASKGWQVVVVDYRDQNSLQFKLAGVDIVLSTVSGAAQLSLIEAAAAAKVQRFVPSEFSGPPHYVRPMTSLTTSTLLHCSG